MRLLKLDEDDVFIPVEFTGEDTPPFGILSHTWGADNDEVTLKDLLDGSAVNKVGCEKLRFCAKQAAADGLQWFWIDTCSIDKTSSAELSEAINSMYQWYHVSSRCYVFLSDVSIEEPSQQAQTVAHEKGWEAKFRTSRWFTRGWTLQELLAPESVEFFSREGMKLGDKRSLGPIIHDVTGIAQRALQGTLPYEFSVDERMSWAIGRKTKREEDMAYSLLGIFDVNMPLLYGEGRKRALTRLYRELKESLTSDPPALLNDQFQTLGLESQTQSRMNENYISEPVVYNPCMPFDSCPIAVAFPSQKEMDVVVLGDDSTLKYKRLENGIANSANWQSDGKWFADVPIMFSSSRSRVELIAPTPYGKVLYQETRTGVLMKDYWESLGHTIIKPLTGVSWAPNRLDIFGLGKEGQVLHKTLAHGSWLPSKTDWEDLGGSFSLPPLVLSMFPGRLDLLCVTNYGAGLHHKWWDGSSWKPSQTEWEHRGGLWMSPPTAVATDRDRLDLFMCISGKVQHAMIKNNWWSVYYWTVEQPGEGAFISRPAAVLSKTGRIDLFCIRNDNELYHRTLLIHENRWDPEHSWKSLGGDFASAPTAIASRSGKVYVFCKGYDEEIYYMNLNEKEWKSLGCAD